MNPWEQILEHLQKNLSPQSYATWLKPAQFSHVEDAVLYVQLPNEAFRRWYNENFLDLFQSALGKLPGIEQIVLLCPEAAGTSPRTRALHIITERSLSRATLGFSGLPTP